MRRIVAIALLVASAQGCATLGSSRADVCPESRALRCATPPTCSPDRARGCQVCGCEAWDPARTGSPEAGGRAHQPERDPAAAPTDVGPPTR